MKKDFLLISASVLSVILMTIHLAGDIVLGMEKGGPLNLIVFPILTAWLYGTLVLSGKRSGYIITFLGALLGLLMPIIHMKGNGINPELMKASGAYLFVWTLIAPGVTSFFCPCSFRNRIVETDNQVKRAVVSQFENFTTWQNLSMD